MNASLNAARRARELNELTEDPTVDVLVIGGGVTGTGVALDAASRGLSVVLAEKHDLAFGTSRFSSKLVHGGLRYLASGAFDIAHESAVERGIMIDHTAPHLVRPFAQVIPLLPGTSRAGALLARSGMLAGDVLRMAAGTSRHTLPPSRRVSVAELTAMAPGVRVDGLRGGLLMWDGQLGDDARLVVALARTAASFGAKILTRCEATGVTGHGATLVDTLTQSTVDVRARMVINAAGVWAGQVAGDVRLRPSRGTHLVFEREAFAGLTAGLTVPVAGSVNRFVFALPSPEGRVYVGLTDEEFCGPIPDVPQATDAEIDFLLDVVNSALAEPLTRRDIVGTFSGLRPLLDDGDGHTADVSRRHAVITAPDGLITVVGGKLTTYRRMAQDAVDAALAAAGASAGPCRTGRLALVGAASRRELAAIRAPRRLVRRYGTEAPLVASDGLEPVADGIATTVAELRFAVRHEGALDVDDVLDRRTRIGLSAADRHAALPAAREAFS